jgi:alcohol dehydrogenase YqhD (iron-dependent ADH family)
MSDLDKLRILLPHWLEHTDEHAEEFLTWAERVQSVKEEMEAAAHLLEQANGRLQEALKKLGGALDP